MASKVEKKEQAAAVKAYLISYNLFQAVGWFYTLVLALLHISSKQTVSGTWSNVHFPLKFFQTLQAIEILHIIVGIVRSPLLTTVSQISSRLFVLWAILYPVPEIVNNFSFIMLLVAWCIAEVTRYLFYATALLKSTPYIIIWCRYTFFFVLYPLGVSGELLSVFAALPYIHKHNLFSYLLPNPANISFYYPYAIYGIVASYIPGFPILFMYMVNQRKKVLNPPKEKSK